MAHSKRNKKAALKTIARKTSVKKTAQKASARKTSVKKTANKFKGETGILDKYEEDGIEYEKQDIDSDSDSDDSEVESTYLHKPKKARKNFMAKVNEIGEIMENYKAEEAEVIKQEQEKEERDKLKPSFPKQTVVNDIKNKQYRSRMLKMIRRRQLRTKKKLREAEKKAAFLSGKKIEKKVPKTIDSKREDDVTMMNEFDEEPFIEEKTDKFASYYNKEYEPKILLTSSERAHGQTLKFMKELSLTMPNATLKWRNDMQLKKMLEVAPSKGYTDAIVIHEDRKKPSGVLIYHFPDGPCAMFRLSSIELTKERKKKFRGMMGYRPEIVLNNFKTSVGRSIGRMLGALYHYDPEFKGRSTVTFHNQRDYIFFRHHRYQFKNTEKVSLKELGPRFTLRLEWLREGGIGSDFEWTLKRHEMETSRTRFFL